MDNLGFNRLPPTRNEQVLVGTSLVRLCDTRTELQPRTALMIQNVGPTAGTDIVYIFIGSSGQATATAWAVDVGDSFFDISDGGYTCNQDTVTIIGATANCKINVIER